MTYQSYWTRTSNGTAYPALAGRTTADVAVVGGGMAGLWTAWELTRAGLRVAVLEAGQIAAATGDTMGKASALQALTYSDILSGTGREAARLYAQAQLEAVKRLAAVVSDLEIDCEFEQRPAYTYATLAESLPALRSEAAAATAAGLPAHLVAGAGLPFPIAGAVRLDGQAQFHPRKLLLALAEDIVRNGSAVYERSRVTRIDDNSPCVVLTEIGGTVAAPEMVVATGYPIASTPGIRHALTTRRELAIAGAVPQERALPGMYITQEEGTRSIRSAPYSDGQRLLIVAGEVFEPGSGGVRERFETLTTWAGNHLGLTRIEHKWSAQDHDSADGIPLIGRASAAPGHRHTWIATGFGGWGLTNAVAAGRLIAAGIDGGAAPAWTPIFDPARLDSRDGAARNQRDQSMHTAVRHPIEPTETAAVAAVAPGQGAVVDVGGEHCAVYRDDGGILHAVSAICTHLGCTVGFNDAERTWECPCHGSRYSVDGAVLTGPAVTPLAPALMLVEQAVHG